MHKKYNLGQMKQGRIRMMRNGGSLDAIDDSPVWRK